MKCPYLYDLANKVSLCSYFVYIPVLVIYDMLSHTQLISNLLVYSVALFCLGWNSEHGRRQCNRDWCSLQRHHTARPATQRTGVQVSVPGQSLREHDPGRNRPVQGRGGEES